MWAFLLNERSKNMKTQVPCGSCVFSDKNSFGKNGISRRTRGERVQRLTCNMLDDLLHGQYTILSGSLEAPRGDMYLRHGRLAWGIWGNNYTILLNFY